MVMAAVTALSMSVSASAESDCDSSMLLSQTVLTAETDDEGYVLVSEEVNKDGDYLIVDRTYELTVLSPRAGNKGSKSVKKSRSIYENENTFGNLYAIMWISGDFKWDEEMDQAKVSNVKAWIEHYSHDGVEIYAKAGYPKYDSNQGATVLDGLFGSKYAYIEYIVVVENWAHFKKEFRLWFDINVRGEEKIKI